MEDQDIIAGLFRRDDSALEELQKAYGAKLLRLAKRFLKSWEDAQEAVNDAYLPPWKKWTGSPPKSVPPQWWSLPRSWPNVSPTPPRKGRRKAGNWGRH